MANDILDAFDKWANLLNVVVLPLILLSLYYGIIASDRYTSEAIFTIKENGTNVNVLDIGVLGLGNPPAIEDERIIMEYMISGDMLEHLDEKLQYRQHFEESGADWFSSLPTYYTREEYLEYYRNHVDAFFDEISGLISIEVQAFEREYARRVLGAMLQHAEEVVNDISHRLAMDQYQFMEKQLGQTQDSLKSAKQRLLAFQNKYQIFSPEQQGQSLSSIMDALEGELSQERAKLKQLLSFQKKDSPQAIAVRERIRALSEQIVDEKLRLIGKGDEKLNDLMAQFIDLQLDLEFAKDAYAAVLAALEQSRAEVSRKMKHLVVISKPSLAEEAEYPDRLYILITALIVLLMCYGIVRMIITTIREHQD